MNVLGIESATIAIGVAIYTDDGPRAHFQVGATRRHVETLHPLIEECCARAEMALSDLGGIGVDVGPGRFTGIRVGMAGAQALGIACDLPVVPIRSTDALVAMAAFPEAVPVIDMRRGEIAYQLDPIEGPVLGTALELARLLDRDDRTVDLIGDGALRYGEEIAAHLERATVRIGSARFGAPDALVVAELAHRALVAGERPASSLEPSYLRPADVKIGWTTRDTLEGQLSH
jgi:tRNA threonylcarbamoyl adenosine modification protein YeaZ